MKKSRSSPLQTQLVRLKVVGGPGLGELLLSRSERRPVRFSVVKESLGRDERWQPVHAKPVSLSIKLTGLYGTEDNTVELTFATEGAGGMRKGMRRLTGCLMNTEESPAEKLAADHQGDPGLWILRDGVNVKLAYDPETSFGTLELQKNMLSRSQGDRRDVWMLVRHLDRLGQMFPCYLETTNLAT